jgi:hypothetical protein
MARLGARAARKLGAATLRLDGEPLFPVLRGQAARPVVGDVVARLAAQFRDPGAKARLDVAQGAVGLDRGCSGGGRR